jgi:site-specific recombinase XerC
MRHSSSQALRAGPFREHVQEFVQHLRSRGYAADTIRRKLQILAEMSRWSVRRRATVFDELRLGEFLRDPRRRHRTVRGVGATGLQIIQCLRASGDLPPASPVARPGRASQIASEYAVYLREERGVAEATVAVYLRMVRPVVRQNHIRRIEAHRIPLV